MLCIPALEYWCAFLDHHLRRHENGVSKDRRERAVANLRHLAGVRAEAPLQALVREVLPSALSAAIRAPLELYVGDNFEGYVFFGVPLPSPTARGRLTEAHRRLRRGALRWMRVGKRVVATAPALLAGTTCMFLGDSISLFVSELVCAPRMVAFMTAAVGGGALTPVVADLVVTQGLRYISGRLGSPPWVLARKVVALYVVPNLLRLLASLLPAHFETGPRKAYVSSVLVVCRHALEDLAASREEGVGTDAYQMLAGMALDKVFELHAAPLQDAAVVEHVTRSSRAAIRQLLEASDASSVVFALMGVAQSALLFRESTASMLGFLRQIAYVASSAAQRAATIWGEATLLSMSPDISSASWRVQAAVLNGDWSSVARAVVAQEDARPRKKPVTLVRELILALDAAYAVRAREELKDTDCTTQEEALSSLAAEWSHALVLVSAIPPRARSRHGGKPQTAVAIFEEGREVLGAALHEVLTGLGVAASGLRESTVPTLWSWDSDLALQSLRTLQPDGRG